MAQSSTCAWHQSAEWLNSPAVPVKTTPPFQINQDPCYYVSPSRPTSPSQGGPCVSLCVWQGLPLKNRMAFKFKYGRDVKSTMCSRTGALGTTSGGILGTEGSPCAPMGSLWDIVLVTSCGRFFPSLNCFATYSCLPLTHLAYHT